MASIPRVRGDQTVVFLYQERIFCSSRSIGGPRRRRSASLRMQLLRAMDRSLEETAKIHISELNRKKKLDAAKAEGAKVVISSPQWLDKKKHYDDT